jgi:hypothetical protein
MFRCICRRRFRLLYVGNRDTPFSSSTVLYNTMNSVYTMLVPLGYTLRNLHRCRASDKAMLYAWSIIFMVACAGVSLHGITVIPRLRYKT